MASRSWLVTGVSGGVDRLPVGRGGAVRRALIPAGALLWGLQFAFLNPALALAIYNAGGFVASLLVPAYADRARDYLRPMLACGVLTLALAGVLAATTSLPVALLALVAARRPGGRRQFAAVRSPQAHRRSTG